MQSQPLLVRAQLEQTGAKYRISEMNFNLRYRFDFSSYTTLVTSLSFELRLASLNWILGFPLARRLTSDPMSDFHFLSDLTGWLPLGNFSVGNTGYQFDLFRKGSFYFQISSAPSVVDVARFILRNNFERKVTVTEMKLSLYTLVGRYICM